MKQKIIALLFKYIPILAKKLWPRFKSSLLGDKTPNIVGFRDDPSSNNVILFVHGFSGEAETTFGNIPQYLSEDEKMSGWNMFSVGYSSDPMPSVGIGIWAAIPDITKLSEFLKTTIRNQFSRYKSIAIIAHSMGGLVTQQAVVSIDNTYRSRIQYVMLFGTPSDGLIKARIVRWWNRQLRDMGRGGEFIKKLRADWTKAFGSNYPFTFKVIAGTDDEFVPTVSSQEVFENRYREVVSGNHLNIVKPQNKNHAGYQLILTTITNTPFIDKHSDKEAVNLLRGNYNAVISELGPNENELGKNGIVKLVFALEGTGNKEKARAVLENYIQRDDKNTDIIGIMGGRYKRDYLDGYKEADGAKSFAYYKKALEAATQSADCNQIFYHAINLAFLSLAYKQDNEGMVNYATTAVDAANKCPDEKWKYATIAEANIYLRQLVTAKEYYSKAAGLADLREKDSMYTNAYMGYTILFNTENENDDFIKFLKITLLDWKF